MEFVQKNGQSGHHAFNIGALKDRGYEFQAQECVLSGIGRGPFFQIDRGALRDCSESSFPAFASDRLALVAASGLAVFRPVFDALSSMGFYNLHPKSMR